MPLENVAQHCEWVEVQLTEWDDPNPHQLADAFGQPGNEQLAR